MTELCLMETLWRCWCVCRRYVETQGESTTKLYITEIVRDDAGNYTCSATIKGQQHRKTVPLLIFSQFLASISPSFYRLVKLIAHVQIMYTQRSRACELCKL